MHRHLHHPLSVATVALVALAVTGCSSSTAPASDPPATEQSSATAISPEATIDNCGTIVAADQKPERIVTIKSTTFELLLALGLQDRLIAASYLDGPVPPAYEDAASAVAVLSTGLPSSEAVLDVEPDFVFGGWESNFSAEGVGEREALQQLGIGTYVAPAACKSPKYMPNPLTFDVVFDSFIEAGELFGAADAAEALVADQRAQLESIIANDDDLTALWYSSGREQPFVGAGIGAPAMLMHAAGLENIFADVEDTWTSTSWEAVAEKNPDVIVLIASPGNTIDDKITLLKSDPVMSTLDAVIHERFITLDFAAAEAGVRNVDAVASLVAQLDAL